MVAGQILAYHLLDEQAIPVENRLKFSRLSAGLLSGKHPWHELLERSGAKVVAIERGNDFIVKFGADFVIEDNDALFVCGTMEGLSAFQREFQSKAYSTSAAPAVSRLP